MAQVRLALQGSPGARPGLAAGPAELELTVAPGETLGRLLARLVQAQPALAELYDPASSRVRETVELTINGRAFHLLGGLTYLLQEGDLIAAVASQAGPDGTPRGQ